MIEETTAFFDGAWQALPGGERATLVDPSTEQPFATVTLADDTTVDAAVAAAQRALPAWSALPRKERVEVMLAMAEFLERSVDRYGDLLLQEVGLPLPFAYGNLVGAAAQLRYYASLSETYAWEEPRQGLSGVRTLITRHPAGVAAAIVPWNAPVSLAASKLAPALLAGCTVVVKAAPLNALSIRCLADAAGYAGAPPGVVNVLTAAAAASEHLVAHPGVDKVAFTGSDATGRRIAEVAARTLKRVTLELGGKSAGVVLPDAPLERLLQTVPQAFTLNNGEACAALTRLVVPRERQAEIVDAVADAVAGIPVGDPRHPSTAVGPLATREHHERVLAYVEQAWRDGGRIACGGTRPDHLPIGYYFAPTVVAGVKPDSVIAQEEVFGPVLTVLTYDTVDEAVEIANGTRYGLSGAVFGASDEEALAVARRLRSGSVHLNNGFTVDIGIPFGGCKASGYGHEFGPEGIDGYVEVQAVFLDGQPYGA